MNIKLTKQLLNNASKLDALCESEGTITQYAKKLIEDYDISSLLLLIKKIDILSNSLNKKIHLQCIELYNSLIMFWGSYKISELSYITKDEEEPEKSLEALQDELDSYIGLKNVKNIITSLINFHRIQLLREKVNLRNTKNTLHMAFIGNPGTGKTTVARIVGKMYKKIGLLSNGHFIEVSRTDLIAGYQGQTALKVKKIIEEAKGGVLFIDEAYSITENSNSDSYGRECLTELTKALEDYRDDLVVIVAGYREPMEQFFESNPGLKSRFNTFLYFEDYDENELFAIFEKICSNSSYFISDKLKKRLLSYFKEQINNKGDNFSNGRLARNLFDKIIINHANRIIQKTSPTKEDLSLLEEVDFDDHNS